jgi:TPR repeat protein
MTHLYRYIASITFSVLIGCQSAALAQISAYKDHYDKQQVRLTFLKASNSSKDQRELAELLRDGLIVGPDNPLRRADRKAAIAAFEKAIQLGDRSPGTQISFARLLLREGLDDRLLKLQPSLRDLVVQGNGDAAYILALFALRNEKQPKEQINSMFEAAAVMGSVPALIDLIGTGAPVGKVIKKTALETLRNRAMSGWAPASFALYEVYMQGHIVTPSKPEAMKWLQRAADQGHVAAIERLGYYLTLGLNVPINLELAADHYRKAANAGSGQAALALGRSIGTTPDLGISPEEGRLWLQRANEAGVKGAAIDLVSLELNIAIATKTDASTKVKLIEAALKPIAQDPQGLTELANHQWTTDAAALIAPTLLPLLRGQTLQGRPSAGLAYNAWLQANGEPLPDDAATALVNALKRQPIISRDFTNFTIANLALDGRISDKIISKPEAVALLFKAADGKVGQAMQRIGRLYQEGDLLAPSPQFAVQWLQRAAEQNVERATWDIAAIGLNASDGSALAKAEGFFRKKLGDGELRAGIILLKHKLLHGGIDLATLAAVKQAAQTPADLLQLAEMLITSGEQDSTALGKQLLSSINDEELDADEIVRFSKLIVRTAVTDKEREAGIATLAKGVMKGSIAAKIALASAYLSSVSYKDKQAYSVALLNEVLSTDPRNDEARLLLSKAYLIGLGIKKNARKASDLIDQIRAEGKYDNPQATMLVANMLKYSVRDRDPDKSVKLLQAQAVRGSIIADRALGEAYLSGFGPTLDPDLAAVSIYRAAEAGDKQAIASFGHLLLNGYGISQSKDAAIEWLSRSAQAGNASAMYELSQLYAFLPKEKSDVPSKIKWLERAAAANHPNANYMLAMAYLKGEAVNFDRNKAIALFERAAVFGNLLAAKTLEGMRGQDQH